MKHNLKFAWAIALVTLLSTGCKKESEVLLKENSTPTNLISGNIGAKPPITTKLFPWEKPDAEKTRQSRKSKKQPYAISLTGSTNNIRQLRFKNDSSLPTGETFYTNAKTLGIKGPWSKQTEKEFMSILQKHMQDPTSSLIGCINAKGEPSHMVNIYNPKTGLNVEIDRKMSGKTEFYKVTQLNSYYANELSISGKWPSLLQ